MSNFPLLQYRALDANGDPISGAKLNFYESGTTTRLATYSDRALTIANANPVVANGDGWFDIIYMGLSAYKVVLTDADDVVIWSEDDVYALQDTLLESKTDRLLTCPTDFGAIGDGVADESAEVQAALDAATVAVDLLGYTFRCDTQITVPDGITLRNGTLDFSQRESSADSGHILIEGSEGDSTTAVTTGLGDETVTVGSASGLSDGQWVVLRSSAYWASASPYGYLGEIAKIQGISGTTVTLSDGVLGEYASADGASLRPLTMASGQRLEDLTIVCSATPGNGIEMSYCENVIIKNVRVQDIGHTALIMRKCAECIVENLHIVAVDEATSTRSRVQIMDGSRHCSFRDISVHHDATLSCAGVLVGEGLFEVQYEVTADCDFSTINASGGPGLGMYISPTTFRTSVSTYNGTNQSYTDQGGASRSSKISCTGAALSVAGNSGVSGLTNTSSIANDLLCVGGAMSLSGFLVVNGASLIENFAGSAVSLGSATGQLLISGLYVDIDSSNDAVNIAAGRVSISASHINNDGSGKALVGDASEIMVNGVTAKSGSGRAIDLTASNSLIVSGCRAYGAAEKLCYLANDSTAKLVFAGNHCITTGNTVNAGFEFYNFGAAVVSGNMFTRGGDSGVCVLANTSNNFVFTGNYVENGTYGLQNSGGTDVLSDGNIYTAQATGNTTGTITNGDEL